MCPYNCLFPQKKKKINFKLQQANFLLNQRVFTLPPYKYKYPIDIIKGKLKVWSLTFTLFFNLVPNVSNVSVGSQIVAHTQVETGDGHNKPNTINL